jgi:polysaccharide pyruvyl transferase WcaK-like protein
MIKHIYKHINKIRKKINWLIVFYLYTFNKNKSAHEIFLVAPAFSDGSFGDELMLKAYLDTIDVNIPVCIFDNRVIANDIDRENICCLDFRFKNYFLLYKSLYKAKELVIVGADILDGGYGLEISVERLKAIRLANKMGLKTKILGFSLNSNVPKAIVKEFKKTSKFCILNMRDSESYNRMVKLINTDVNVRLTADVVFLSKTNFNFLDNDRYINYTKWILDMKQKNKTIIGFCPNAIQASKRGEIKYFFEMLSLLKYLNAKGDYAFVFLYHDLRFASKDLSDSILSAYLSDIFRLTNPNLFYTNQIKNGVELRSYLECVDFTVTGRMHFGISGLTMGKPMFGIGYQDKFTGLYNLFGLKSDYCGIDYNDLSSSKLKSNLNNFIENQKEIKDTISKNIDNVNSLAKLNFS